MYQNKVTLIGFLGNDAEVRTNNDRSFTTLSLATKSSYKKDGKYISHTEWHRCIVFGKLPEFAKTLTKGAHVQVEGELRSREYENKKTDAKQRVWSYAMANCGERGDSTGGGAADATGVAKGAESNGDNGGADTSEASHAKGAPHQDVITKDLGSATITVEGSVTASGILGGAKAKQGAYRKVMCNEPPYDGDLVSTAKAAYHDMTGW